MKKACLISGLHRSLRYNVDKIKHVFGNETDYFIHITNNYKDQYNHMGNDDIDKIIEKLNPVQILKENDKEFKNTGEFTNIKRQWYKFSVINNIRKYYEKINKIHYDLIIRIRPDLFILDNELITENVMDKVLYGNNDEFFYGNSNAFDMLSNLIFSFDDLLNIDGIHNADDIFRYYLNTKKITLQNIKLKYKLVLSECNIIAVSGDSGSGKSTLINNIDKLFDKSLKIEGDRYHKWERGDINWEKYTHLNPKANYICKFKEDTFKLKIGENIYQVDYDHATGKFTEKEELQNSQNILICGLHTLFDDSVNGLFNLKIFLDTDVNLKYYWKIKRDVTQRGYTTKEVLNKIKQREKDSIEYIEPQKNKSDIIIRFFTDDIFDYNDIHKEPNIYLNITSKKNMFDFIKILDKYDTEYYLSKKNKYNSITFYKIMDFNQILFEFIEKEIILLKNNYYSIILAFILFHNNVTNTI